MRLMNPSQMNLTVLNFWVIKNKAMDWGDGWKDHMPDSPRIWTDSRCMGPTMTGVKATWHPHGLSKLQEIPNGNILHPTIDPGQWTLIWEESHQIHTFIRIFCWKIWFCVSYKTHSRSNNHGSTSFMRDNM